MFSYLLKKFFHFRETEKSRIGRIGENAACGHLRKSGMKIIARNFKSGKNEIDIVAADGDCLVFAEVKTRAENAAVSGYYAAIGKQKRRAVKACAKSYMAAMRHRPHSWRFDAIEVTHDGGGKILKISHYANLNYRTPSEGG